MTETPKTNSAMSRSGPKRNRKPAASRLGEAAVWQPAGGGWKQLYGGYYDLGVSIEWQEFEVPHAFEWSRSFHLDSLELCLNLAGHGSVNCGESTLSFEPLTAGFYLPGNRALQAWRDARHAHRFLTVEFAPRFLRQQLSRCDGALHPLVEDFVRGDVPRAPLGELHRLTAGQEQRIAHLLHPPVLQGARPIWYQGKVLEFMAEFFFERRGEDELFCDRQKRLARERADRVVALLQQRGVNVSVRRSKGAEIEAACGQLRQRQGRTDARREARVAGNGAGPSLPDLAYASFGTLPRRAGESLEPIIDYISVMIWARQ